MNFSQFVNQNVTILGRRLYSPSLKDVAWLEDVQVIFLIFHTFVCKFCRLDKRLDAVCKKKCSDRKLKKLAQHSYILQTWWIQSSACSILTFWFTDCEFWKSYLPSDSLTNTVVSDRFAYPSRWRRKPW